ncbi:uncharacterized protein VTP21DRAFT_6729 [Calcarisporiella thermophila]|uniref:uncharacterized protein n=1 Tax=Calcarisporiella thermophila TaxID=911321 RepID=UPI0037446396
MTVTTSSQPQFRSKRQQVLYNRQLRHNSNAPILNQTAFRQCERIYKKRGPNPPLTDVLDFHNLADNKDKLRSNVVEVELKKGLRNLSPLFGECDENYSKNALRAYVLRNVPGFIFIPNPWTPAAQRHILKNCIGKYARHPNKCSLDANYELPAEGLWPIHARIRQGVLSGNESDCYIPLLSDGGHEQVQYGDRQDEEGESRELVREIEGKKAHVSHLLKRIRWVTLGYQYHWGSKSYHLDQRMPFPKDIGELSIAVARAVEGIGLDEQEVNQDAVSEEGRNGWRNVFPGDKFRPEAGVINYYQLRDTLMAHVDRSELCMDPPLISFSFGHSCIYLMGGPTRDYPPVPVLLRSGDIVVMTGPCRKGYHGVPRILESTLPEYLYPNAECEGDNDGIDWTLFGEYMLETRVNVNVRQVFP